MYNEFVLQKSIFDDSKRMGVSLYDKDLIVEEHGEITLENVLKKQKLLFFELNLFYVIFVVMSMFESPLEPMFDVTLGRHPFDLFRCSIFQNIAFL